MYRFFLFMILFMTMPTYGFFYEGDLILGVSLGGGNTEYSSGFTGAVANFSAEVTIDSWRFGDITLSTGMLVNGSVFFSDDEVQGGMSFMPTFHFNFIESVDWYVGLGFGITMKEHLVLYGVGFSTGFNVLTREWLIIYMGLDIQGPQIFGSVGFKFLV